MNDVPLYIDDGYSDSNIESSYFDSTYLHKKMVDKFKTLRNRDQQNRADVLADRDKNLFFNFLTGLPRVTHV